MANSDQLYEDLNFLLSTIRVRQNNFILFQERMRNSSDYDRLKQLSRFLQEQARSADTVQQVAHQYSGSGYTEPKITELIARFWNKLLKLIRVSLERLKLLGLLNKRIWDAYTEVIALLNSALTSTDLRLLRMLEAVFRRRYMSLVEESGQHKQRYIETLAEKEDHQLKQSRPTVIRRNLEESLPQKMKSLNRDLSKKRSEQSISKRVVSASSHRLLKARTRVDDVLYKDLDLRTDTAQIDPKKPREMIAAVLYDQLFGRNIPNHKTITKYIFGVERSRELLRTCSANGSTRQTGAVSIKPRTLLDVRKECLNKSARKYPEKECMKEKLAATTAVNLKKPKKKVPEQMDLESPQMLFGSSRLKRLDQRLTKLRPKTAKLQKQQLKQLRIGMESAKKRCRKLMKKLTRA